MEVMTMKKTIFVVIGILVSASIAPLFAAGWGRISYIEGEVFIIGEHDTRWGYATINTIIEEGDIIRTENNSRVEVQLEDGVVVRLDELSELEFTVLDEDGQTVVTAIDGVIAASLPYWLSYRDFHIAFPSGELEPYRGAKVRVEVEEDRGTYVIVRRERAILTTFGDERRLAPHRIAFVDWDGEIRWIDRYYDRDSFDRWCDRRDEIVLRRPSVPPYVDFDIVVGVIDLDFYGHWSYVPPYGWVWVPDVAPDWRPYWHGHWVWTYRWGWVWVPYEPWGWVTCHYGRWAFVVGVGWVWVPRPVFAPAWVVWSFGTGWVAWAPLDPFGRPITVVNNITIINIIDYESFRDPVYRYRPPVDGRYDKPYRVVSRPSVNLTKISWEKKPRQVIKPAPPREDVKRKLLIEKAKSVQVIEKSPVRTIVSSKIERRKQVLQREGIKLSEIKPKTAIDTDRKISKRKTTYRSKYSTTPKADYETETSRRTHRSKTVIDYDEESRKVDRTEQKSPTVEKRKTTYIDRSTGHKRSYYIDDEKDDYEGRKETAVERSSSRSKSRADKRTIRSSDSKRKTSKDYDEPKRSSSSKSSRSFSLPKVRISVPFLSDDDDDGDRSNKRSSAIKSRRTKTKTKSKTTRPTVKLRSRDDDHDKRRVTR
ncbi:MAG: hypothetical protein DRQ10_06920 [Candidatus Hydrothermota bacterium]|nr:MAG: hypothetical protein DRQ10_06920 [Candidatus Hydrothermae bacterium]